MCGTVSWNLHTWILGIWKWRTEEYPGICMYRGGRWRSHSRWHGRTPYGRAAGVQHGRTATTGVRHGGNGGGGEGGVAMRAGASEMSSGKRLSADAVTTRPWPRGLKTASSKPSARAPSPWACAVVVTCFQFLSVILVCAWWQNSGGNIVLVLGVLRTLSLRHGKSHSNPRVREYAIIRVSFRIHAGHIRIRILITTPPNSITTPSRSR